MTEHAGRAQIHHQNPGSVSAFHDCISQATLYSFATFEEEKSMRGYPPPSKLSSARQFVYRAPAWPLPVIWCTLHILHAASLGFGKWISEAWAATFLALCTRCTLSWAAESPNTCWAWLRPFRWHQEPAERRGKATLERVAVDSKIN